jgi:hypothetical protein
MDLRTTTTHLLNAPDIGQWLRRADNYIQAYNRMREGFTLPADHAILRAVIEAFAADAAAWADYIRALRDAVEGAAYDDLHDLYRTTSIRALQVIRRTRLRKAVLLLQPEIENLLGRAINYTEQTQVASGLEQIWGAARMALMSRERKEVTANRLSSEERAAILTAYWKDIDNKLAKGVVPLFDTELTTVTKVIK